MQSLLLNRKQPTHRQRGQGMAEYIIIVALVAVAGIAVWSSVGSAIHHQASGVAAELAGGSGAAEQGLANTAATTAATESVEQDLGDYHGQN